MIKTDASPLQMARSHKPSTEMTTTLLTLPPHSPSLSDAVLGTLTTEGDTPGPCNTETGRRQAHKGRATSSKKRPFQVDSAPLVLPLPKLE